MYSAAAARGTPMVSRRSGSAMAAPPPLPAKKKLSFQLNFESSENSGLEDKCVQTPTAESLPPFPPPSAAAGRSDLDYNSSGSDLLPGPARTHTFSTSGPPEGKPCFAPAPTNGVHHGVKGRDSIQSQKLA